MLESRKRVNVDKLETIGASDSPSEDNCSIEAPHCTSDPKIKGQVGTGLVDEIMWLCGGRVIPCIITMQFLVYGKHHSNEC